MHKRNITVVLCLVLLMALFFQYNRSDGFIRLLKNTNASQSLAGTIAIAQPPGELAPVERYLVVYDTESAYSLLLKRNIEKTIGYLKKEASSIAAKELVSGELNYTGIIFAMDDLDKVRNMEAVRNYVQRGGKVYFLFRPAPGAMLQAMRQELGFDSIGEVVTTSGLKLLSNILIKSKGFELTQAAYIDSSLRATVNPAAQVHMVSQEGVPLLWEYAFGNGKYIVYNGTGLGDKANRGLLTGILALGRDCFAYPVIGIKTVYIDDFPAPIPEGYHPMISRDYHMDIPQFYRLVWWPDILRTAEKYNVRYTGMIIETYNDQVTPPFQPEANNRTNRNNLIVYGRELLKSGGELGIHGYNHQSLTGQEYVRQVLGYNLWGSEDDMSQSLQEVKRYVAEIYPDYKLKVYVPPSNVLSPEGRAALRQALPDLKIIASIHFADKENIASYVQEYERSADGILEMPRLSYNYSRSNASDWEILNGISYLGVFSHFIHPDNIFYEENKDKSWKELYADYDSLLREVQEKFSWLRNCTASQSGEYFENYLDMNYRLVEEANRLTISSWGFRDTAYIILKTTKKIREAKGCEAELIDDNVYLLKIHEPQVILKFEGEVKP